MEVREIADKNTWEGFFEGVQEKTFLQSWNWGEFQKKMGNNIWRLGAFNGQGIAGAALAVKVQAKRGTFLVVQHLAPMGREAFVLIFEEMKRIGTKERVSFIRMAPLWGRNKENEQFFRRLGFRGAPMHANAYEATWKLDSTPSEEDLLKRMRKTTRYLIRHAEKNTDISVQQSNRPEDVELYELLNREAARRQQFVPFSKEFTKGEFDTFSRENQSLWLFGSYRGELAAAALVVFWSGIGFYHQAASNSKYAKLSLPYLVQWAAIKEAKRRGCALYDFWGYVDPKKHSKHPWAGPTLFKMGFGGAAFEYVQTKDYPLNWRYWPVAAFEAMRKIKRGL